MVDFKPSKLQREAWRAMHKADAFPDAPQEELFAAEDVDIAQRREDKAYGGKN